MCGIVGYLGAYGTAPDVVTTMADRLRHRGPDDAGSWVDADHGLGLGHRRLAIVDLSPQGHQPMLSRCGRFVIVYNGEIYNAQDIAAHLAPVAWRGHSDTEVLIESIAQRGIESTLKTAVGMFAFAVWDRQEATLVLARDRMGEKPLYWSMNGGRLVFASELKALQAFPGITLTVSGASVAEVLRRGYIPAPASIYDGVQKLPPASWMTIHRGPSDELVASPIHRYWQVDTSAMVDLRRVQSQRSDEDLIDHVQSTIDGAVRQQMVAEVPLGAFLSGGIDSSLVVASMQRQSSTPVRTFTIGFTEEAYNEAPFAVAVARHIGTQHTELIARPQDAEAMIPRLAQMFDEPFADASQIPTALVAHLTRQHVTVSLSGDGGDEWFAGYPRYFQAEALWNRLGRRPTWLRSSIRVLARSCTPATWDTILRILPGRGGVTGHRLHRLAEILESENLASFFAAFMLQRADVSSLMAQPAPAYCGPSSAAGAAAIDVMRGVDIASYLPDDILVKVDRATMAASLEARAPLLDHRVAELAWSLPERVLRRDGHGKWILRRVLERRVPRELFDRPKTGFALPVAEWLRGPLRDWAESLLNPQALAQTGWLNAVTVQRLWNEHISQTHDRQAQLWNILMLQAWLMSAR